MSDWYGGGAATPRGRITAYNSANGSDLWSASGTGFGDTLGKSLAPAGDLNGDGVPDLFAGAPMHECDCPFNGKVIAYSGSSGAVIFTATGTNALGWSVANLGDVNLDGIDDCAAGAPTSYFYDITHGDVFLLSGIGGAHLLSVPGVANGSFLGASVAGVGDMNLDGVPDLAIGSPGTIIQFYGSFGGFLFPPTGAGSVRIVSGAGGGALAAWSGAAEGDAFGFALASAGDSNGDGVPDVLIGAPGADAPGIQSGRASVYSGATGAQILSVAGQSAGELLGAALADLGDIDVDGARDLAVGAPFATSGGFAAAGSARVFVHPNTFLLGSIDGPQSGLSFGAALAAGDVNGDGVSELLVGGSAGPGAPGATLASLVPFGLKLYGRSSPGCDGPHRLMGSGVPFIGSATFEIRTDRAPASSLGIVVLTDRLLASGADPFGVGLNLYIDFAASNTLVLLDHPADAAGIGHTPLPIPPMPTLAGQRFTGQSIFAWGAPCTPAPLGLSASNALVLLIQP
ncbi:MAG: FG-GAP repeat protein [Planctomycetes bacterium]|nr:FG-GAP repeat protein [Planctomycetota bacterium]